MLLSPDREEGSHKNSRWASASKGSRCVSNDCPSHRRANLREVDLAEKDSASVSRSPSEYCGSCGRNEASEAAESATVSLVPGWTAGSHEDSRWASASTGSRCFSNDCPSHRRVKSREMDRKQGGSTSGLLSAYEHAKSGADYGCECRRNIHGRDTIAGGCSLLLCGFWLEKKSTAAVFSCPCGRQAKAAGWSLRKRHRIPEERR